MAGGGAALNPLRGWRSSQRTGTTMPREVGQHPEEDKRIVAGIGRYGPFLEMGGRYARLQSTEEVEISGLHLNDSGGDGIYLGRGTSGLPYNKNIHVHDVVCDNNARQGISVIGSGYGDPR